jgi:hypothetical protein
MYTSYADVGDASKRVTYYEMQSWLNVSRQIYCVKFSDFGFVDIVAPFSVITRRIAKVGDSYYFDVYSDATNFRGYTAEYVPETT